MDDKLHSIIELPTIADIEASTDVLSVRTNAIKVVRVKERFAVKMGKVPVPKVHPNFIDPETQKRYVVMDYVPGTDLQKLLPSLTSTEKTMISQRIRQAINELRTIPSPGYFGSLNYTPYTDGVLSTPDNNPIISGPFADQKQMNQGILERLGQMQSPHYIRLLKEMVNCTLKNHRICLYSWRSATKERNCGAKRDTMFDEVDDASRREKCFTTITRLPAFIDPKQIPTKRSPFSTIQNHAFVHTVEAILPREVYAQIKSRLKDKIEKPQYARVFMAPSALLEHDFFNTYIKTGNILVISEGRSGSDNVFTLRDGVLRMELGKEIYERTGLTGKPIRSGGRKHAKERFLVELNLRLPSMLHGKKGFERIVWAFENVLNQRMAWLFHNLESKPGGAEEIDNEKIITPPFCQNEQALEEMVEADLQEYCGSLSEWIAMVQMNSPRVSADDNIDPYLSRYAVPDADESRALDLVKLKWHGLISSQWVMQLFLNLLQNTKTSNSSWFVLAAAALGKEAVEGRDGFTVMAIPTSTSSEQSQEDGQAAEDKTGSSDRVVMVLVPSRQPHNDTTELYNGRYQYFAWQ
ncbi:Ribonuclease P Rpp40 [Penicillium bovifimosum]|uniref:Ribonuclease P Rpp40 n=1 Tax=Penicillium bovifimosum TaxID=126998 RepID=A0A9W9H4S1_9EURO|nr:Ribonuclease P Rpp40 [Penicillium bovifimosum]KAJ5138635.1 Ribonuclease P Rpp40 [Penicillium bovifimosum]